MTEQNYIAWESDCVGTGLAWDAKSTNIHQSQERYVGITVLRGD
jgi:hypothetical protein